MKSLKKILAITLSLIMALGIVSVSAFAEDVIEDNTEAVENEVISAVDITVVRPVAGEYAVGDYVFDSADYSVEFLQWVGYGTEDILYSTDPTVEVTDAAFETGAAYVVCITVVAEEGFVFDAAENLAVTVNGSKAVVADLSDDATELSFTCVFECADSAELGDEEGGFDFSQVLEFLKTLLMTFVRFIGSIFGIS